MSCCFELYSHPLSAAKIAGSPRSFSLTFNVSALAVGHKRPREGPRACLNALEDDGEFAHGPSRSLLAAASVGVSNCSYGRPQAGDPKSLGGRFFPGHPIARHRLAVAL